MTVQRSTLLCRVVGFSYTISLPLSFEYKRLYERLDTLKDVYKIVIDEQGR